VNEKEPTPVGVPLIWPDDPLSVSPGGREPDATAHVMAPVPPLEASVFEYCTPNMPAGKDVVVT
jgi:hypothetical protein